MLLLSTFQHPRSGGIRAHRSDLEQARKSDSTHVGSLAEIAEVEEISKWGKTTPRAVKRVVIGS